MKWKRKNFDNEILLICASAQHPSINANVLEKFSQRLLKEGISIEKLYLREYVNIPMLINEKRIPLQIPDIYATIVRYRYIVIFAPEHGGYLTAFFKNILDWLSVVGGTFLENRNVFLVSVSITQRTKRVMEQGVKNTLGAFAAGGEIEFVNYNRYNDDGESEERIEALFQGLWCDNEVK